MNNENLSVQDQMKMAAPLVRAVAKRDRPKRDTASETAAAVACCKALSTLTEEQQRKVIACLAQTYLEPL